MMHLKLRLLALCTCFYCAGVSSYAASADTYQVTGPIVALTTTTITVQKGDEKWEIARDGGTKAPENLKVGDRVTIHYRMVATKIETKTGTPAAKKKKNSSD